MNEACCHVAPPITTEYPRRVLGIVGIAFCMSVGLPNNYGQTVLYIRDVPKTPVFPETCYHVAPPTERSLYFCAKNRRIAAAEKRLQQQHNYGELRLQQQRKKDCSSSSGGVSHFTPPK
jgi:hypothetical protein